MRICGKIKRRHVETCFDEKITQSQVKSNERY